MVAARQRHFVFPASPICSLRSHSARALSLLLGGNHKRSSKSTSPPTAVPKRTSQTNESPIVTGNTIVSATGPAAGGPLSRHRQVARAPGHKPTAPIMNANMAALRFPSTDGSVGERLNASITSGTKYSDATSQAPPSMAQTMSIASVGLSVPRKYPASFIEGGDCRLTPKRSAARIR